jgi:hypothetical protein
MQCCGVNNKNKTMPSVANQKPIPATARRCVQSGTKNRVGSQNLFGCGKWKAHDPAVGNFYAGDSTNWSIQPPSYQQQGWLLGPTSVPEIGGNFEYLIFGISIFNVITSRSSVWWNHPSCVCGTDSFHIQWPTAVAKRHTLRLFVRRTWYLYKYR